MDCESLTVKDYLDQSVTSAGIRIANALTSIHRFQEQEDRRCFRLATTILGDELFLW